MPGGNRKVCILIDSRKLKGGRRDQLQQIVEDTGWQCRPFDDGMLALQAFNGKDSDCTPTVIVAHFDDLPRGDDGREILDPLCRAWPDAAFVLFSGGGLRGKTCGSCDSSRVLIVGRAIGRVADLSLAAGLEAMASSGTEEMFRAIEGEAAKATLSLYLGALLVDPSATPHVPEDVRARIAGLDWKPCIDDARREMGAATEAGPMSLSAETASEIRGWVRKILERPTRGTA